MNWCYTRGKTTLGMGIVVEVLGRLASIDGKWVEWMLSRDGDADEYERFVSEMVGRGGGALFVRRIS